MKQDKTIKDLKKALSSLAIVRSLKKSKEVDLLDIATCLDIVEGYVAKAKDKEIEKLKRYLSDCNALGEIIDEKDKKIDELEQQLTKAKEEWEERNSMVGILEQQLTKAKEEERNRVIEIIEKYMTEDGKYEEQIQKTPIWKFIQKLRKGDDEE